MLLTTIGIWHSDKIQGVIRVSLRHSASTFHMARTMEAASNHVTRENQRYTTYWGFRNGNASASVCVPSLSIQCSRFGVVGRCNQESCRESLMGRAEWQWHLAICVIIGDESVPPPAPWCYRYCSAQSSVLFIRRTRVMFLNWDDGRLQAGTHVNILYLYIHRTTNNRRMVYRCSSS